MSARSPRRLSAFVLLVVLAAGVAWAIGPPRTNATSGDSLADTVITLLNRDRSATGLPPLQRHQGLDELASNRAASLAVAGTLSHKAAGDLATQLTAGGIRWLRFGETIGWSPRAWGNPAATDVYAMWKSSPSHWAILTGSTFDRIGVGFVLAVDGRAFASAVLIESATETRPAPTPAPTSPPPTSVDPVVRPVSSPPTISLPSARPDVPLRSDRTALPRDGIRHRAGSGSWLISPGPSIATHAPIVL
jgi:uncharacterized protein YkwD